MTGNTRNKATISKKSSIQSKDATSSTLPVYKIVYKDTYDSPIKTQVEIHAVVSGKITESGLRILLQRLYNESKNIKGFKYCGGKHR